MSIAVPVYPGPELQPAINDNHAAFGKPTGDILGKAAPRHNVDKVRIVLAVRVFDIPVTGDAERTDGRSLGGVAQLGVGHQPAHDRNVIQHDRFSSLIFVVFRS